MLLVAGLLACSGSTASAKPLRCGDTVTSDTTLRADLTGCPAEGLVIGADRITLDLNGHTITGSLSGDGGIDNSAGHDGVTIKNGAVRNFTNGVVLGEHATGNRVQRLTLVADNSTDAENGILIFDSDHNQIEQNAISGSGGGISLFNADRNVFDRNRVSGVNVGISMFFADRNAIKRNTLADLRGADLTDAGVVLLGSSENVLERNTIVRTQSGALLLQPDSNPQGVTRYPTGNVITGNTMAANLFYGVALFEANANQVTRNSVTDAGTNGDPNNTNAASLGLVIDGGSGNLLARNAITRGRGVGIQIGGGLSSIAPSDNTVARNETTRNASDGIRVVDVAQNTTVTGNLANGNAADGIHVLSAATTLTRNLAVRNVNLGIEAVPGVTDGGGNHAFRNGNPLQCSGTIAC